MHLLAGDRPAVREGECALFLGLSMDRLGWLRSGSGGKEELE